MPGVAVDVANAAVTLPETSPFAKSGSSVDATGRQPLNVGTTSRSLSRASWSALVTVDAPSGTMTGIGREAESPPGIG